jgi:hypothetical protein
MNLSYRGLTYKCANRVLSIESDVIARYRGCIYQVWQSAEMKPPHHIQLKYRGGVYYGYASDRNTPAENSPSWKPAIA